MPEMVLGEALRLRGHKVVIAFCRGATDRCDNMMLGDHPGLTCRECIATSGIAAARANLETVALEGRVKGEQEREFREMAANLSPDEIVGHVQDGIPLGDFARTSALRHVLKGNLDVSEDSEDVEVLRRYFLSALRIHAAATHILDEVRPDRILTSHGIYISWGIVTELAKQREIPVIVWAGTYSHDKLFFVHGDTYHRSLVNEPDHIWHNRGLTEEERSSLMAYLESKRSGSRDDISHHRHSVRDEGVIRHDLAIPDGKSVVGVFTNVSWDAAILEPGAIFEGVSHWLCHTVEQMLHRTDVHLVIRVHPAEVEYWKESREKMEDVLVSRFGTLPSHIRLVGPSDRLSSYTIADQLDVAIVFSTKLGLELAIRGLPVITAGRPLYRGKGFTHDPQTLEEYDDLLSGVAGFEPLNRETRRRAEEYGYYYYFRCHKWLPFLRKRVDPGRVGLWKRLSIHPIQLDVEDWRDLKAGQSNTLDQVCEGIVSLTPFSDA